MIHRDYGLDEGAVRGSGKVAGSQFSYVDLEQTIPARHPPRSIRSVVNDALRCLDREFDRLYAGEGGGGPPSHWCG